MKDLGETGERECLTCREPWPDHVPACPAFGVGVDLAECLDALRWIASRWHDGNANLSLRLMARAQQALENVGDFS